jgi:hypothetical protein
MQEFFLMLREYSRGEPSSHMMDFHLAMDEVGAVPRALLSTMRRRMSPKNLSLSAGV